MVTQTHHDVTLHVHCLPRLLVPMILQSTLFVNTLYLHSTQEGQYTPNDIENYTVL